ncbi:hypothetical protein TNCV_3181661 [Trichonephila clavipes]|nr:hypothetical protein TNCV_3181661 [Trichonephila clavipes]
MCVGAFAPILPASSTERLSAAMRAGVSLKAASAAKRPKSLRRDLCFCVDVFEGEEYLIENSAQILRLNPHKLKLDGTRATARQRLFPEGWEEMKNHMKENGSNQENSTAERGGRTYPETRNALSMQSAGGEGRTREGSRDG